MIGDQSLRSKIKRIKSLTLETNQSLTIMEEIISNMTFPTMLKLCNHLRLKFNSRIIIKSLQQVTRKEFHI